MLTRLLLTSLLCIPAQSQAGICTREYTPVCGQLSQHVQTFANRCMMKDAGASWRSNGECPSEHPPLHSNPLAKDITLTVAAHDVACHGPFPMRCLQVKEGSAPAWSNFYDQIEGFTFTPGVQYTLRVRATPIANPPADASNMRYQLLRVLSREPKP